MRACDACMRRTWLLERVSGFLEFQRRSIAETLGLADETLIELWQKQARRRHVADELDREYARFGASQARARRADAEAAGLELVCACDPAYPEALLQLRTPPAVLHVAGGVRRFLELARADPVAIVGTRRPTAYGTDVATVLGRGVAVSGLCVVSGMALGVDAAAHTGALAGGGRTVAVLPGCAATPYPGENRRLHREILKSGVAISELGPEAAVRKWTFIARNRVIAGLSRLTVVVQARSRSGALSTAAFAKQLGRPCGAVPGQVQIPQSEGPHRLLREGAVLIREPQDVLDTVFGAGVRSLAEALRADLSADQRAVLDAVRSGVDTVGALLNSGVAGGQAVTALAELELSGHVRRGAGGRYRAAL